MKPRAAQHRIAAAVSELDVPIPFDLGAFGARLQRGRSRPVHLVPFGIAPDLFGAWIRTAAADYLYYEQQTSPFHQAHIVASLAAPVLLGQEHGVPLLAGALPEAGPQLAELILGPASRSPVTRQDAATFAFLLLDRATRRKGQQVKMRRWLRQLRPLHAALREVVAETAEESGKLPAVGVGERLCRRVVEIRSAQLALRPYQDPQVPIAADAAGRAAGLTGDDLAATVEAAVTAAALRAQKNGAQRRSGASDMSWLHRPALDLSSEAAWLARVSRAFTRSPLAGDLARNGWREDPPNRATPSVIGERPHRR